MTPKQQAWQDWIDRNSDAVTLRELFASEPDVSAKIQLFNLVRRAFMDGVAIGEMIERTKEKK